MMKLRGFVLVVMLIGMIGFAKAQGNYGPEKPKEFEMRIMKKKTLYVPIIDRVPDALLNMEVFKGLTTDKKIDAKWESLWKEGIEKSTYDFTEFEVKNFLVERIKKEGDRNGIILYIDKDFYGNFYAYIADLDPKFQILASAHCNGLELTNPDDIALLMNMLQYSLIQTASFYGDDARSLGRDFENEYQQANDRFSDSLKSRTLYLREIGKDEHRRYKKLNDKMEEYLEEEWKLTPYQFMDDKDYDKIIREGGFEDGYYLKEFDIITSNPRMTLKHYVVIWKPYNVVLFQFKGGTELRHRNLQYLQDALEEWMLLFMDSSKRRAYEQAKLRKQQPAKKQPDKKTENKKKK